MLTTRPKGKIIEKYVYDHSGRLFHAFFLVAEWEGQVFVRVLSSERVKDSSLKSPFQCLLSSKCSCSKIKSTYSRIVRSPYIGHSIKDLTFVISQLTRAPSL